MADTSTTIAQLDDKISSLTKQIADLQAERANDYQQTLIHNQSYNDWLAAGNEVEAHKQADIVNQLNSRMIAIDSQLPSLKSLLQAYIDQKAVAVQAQQAIVNQANAAAAQTNAAANLTPEQIFQLQLAKQNADQAAATSKTMEAQTADKEKKDSQKRLLIIAGVVAILFVAGMFIYKMKKA